MTASFGGRSVEIAVTTTAATLSSIAITPSAAVSIPVGSTQALTATATYSDSTTADITKTVSWSIDQFGRASISNLASDKGTVTGISTGAVVVTATLGSSSITKSITITAAEGNRLALTPSSATIESGDTEQYVAKAFYTNNSSTDVTNTSTWSSSSSGIASITSGGLATGSGSGTTTISATNGSLTGTSTLTVTPILSSIAVTPSAPSMSKGQTQIFTATGTYSDSATADLTSSVTWSVTNGTGSASISSAGLLTTSSGSMGTVNVVATLGSISGSTTVTITAPVPTSIAITPSSPSATAGTTTQLTATATYSFGSPADVTSSVTWTSSDTSKATV